MLSKYLDKSVASECYNNTHACIVTESLENFCLDLVIYHVKNEASGVNNCNNSFTTLKDGFSKLCSSLCKLNTDFRAFMKLTGRAV